MKEFISSIYNLLRLYQREKSLVQKELARKLIETAWKSGLLKFIISISAIIPALYFAGNYVHKNYTSVEMEDSLAGEVTRLRMLAYGYDNEKKLHFGKLMELDLLMESQIYYENYNVKIRKLTPETIDGIFNIFNMKKGDKDKLDIFNKWFSKRYIPTYRAFYQALYSIRNKPSFDEINELKPLQMVDYLTRLDIPPMVYETRQIPVFDNPITNTNTNKSDIDHKVTALIKQAKEKINTTEFKTQADEIEQRNIKIKEQKRKQLE